MVDERIRGAKPLSMLGAALDPAAMVDELEELARAIDLCRGGELVGLERERARRLGLAATLAIAQLVGSAVRVIEQLGNPEALERVSRLIVRLDALRYPFTGESPDPSELQ